MSNIENNAPFSNPDSTGIELLNLGRVVGMSAYEIYIKQAVSEDPDTTPSTEREWLASTIAMGSSMLLRVGAAPSTQPDGPYSIDIQLPEDTRLLAANTIIGNWFNGEGDLPDPSFPDTGHTWARKVIDYGPLINNNPSSFPSGFVGPTDSVAPTNGPLDDLTPDRRDALRAYSKLIDGIVIYPGTWSPNPNPGPQQGFEPFVRGVGDRFPRVRLFFGNKVEHPFWVLLTGFTIRHVVNGVTGIDGVNTQLMSDAFDGAGSQSPSDGDFLGPAAFPWANKIVFSVPTAFVHYFLKMGYTRQLPIDRNPPGLGPITPVKTDAVIDMETSNPETYYDPSTAGAATFRNGQLPMMVNDFATLGDGVSVLTVYQRNNILPPALFGTRVDKDDPKPSSNALYPLDTQAPGTVKLFDGSPTGSPGRAATDAVNQIPHNTGLVRDNDSIIHQVTVTNGVTSNTPAGSIVPVANTTILPIPAALPAAEFPIGGGVLIQTGTRRAFVVPFDPSGNVIIPGWVRVGGGVNQNATLTATMGPGSSGGQRSDRLAINRPIRVGDGLGNDPVGETRNYVEFNNGLRLYIAGVEPSPQGGDPIPIGSIGIGWGIDDD